MNFFLIEPAAPVKNVYSNVSMPRLGLPILGKMLIDSGHNVKLKKGARRDISRCDLKEADVVCISTTTSTIVEAYSLADDAREAGKKVIMGGAHVSFLPEEALEHCDYVCRGEADTNFLPLVSCIEKNEQPLGVNGVSYRCGEKIVHNPDVKLVDLNRVPIPDLGLFEDLKLTTYPVMTSRGCPHNCTFCSVTPMFGHRFRCRSNENLLEELKQYRGKKVFFVDDNFTASPRRSKLLLKEMIRRDILPSWWCAQVRVDAAGDPELLRLMRETNCRMVFVGMESINQATLESYNKKQSVDDIINCVEKFHELGIMVHGMFVFGADEDSEQTIEQTLEFALEHRIDTVQFLVLTPLPGTGTYAELKREGRILTRDWSLYDAHYVVFKPRQMSPYQLQKATGIAFKKFYSFTSIFRNVFITGLKSVAFKALGFWLVRKWDKDSRWYLNKLKKIARQPVKSGTGEKAAKGLN